MCANHIADAVRRSLADLTESVARLIDHLVIALHPGCREDLSSARVAVPVPPGLYHDRFGGLWEKTTTGWRVWLRSGAVLEVVRDDYEIDYGIRSFAPFTPLLFDHHAVEPKLWPR